MTKFDWPALMRLGLGPLRLTPDQFWAMTPVELALMSGLDGQRVMNRAGLSDLMAQYPDDEE